MDELTELRQQVAQLENRVAELEKTVQPEQEEPKTLVDVFCCINNRLRALERLHENQLKPDTLPT